MKLRLGADQQHARAELTGGLDRALDFGLRGAVGTHRIQSYDAWHGVRYEQLAGFLDLDHFAPLVITALGAGAMRHLFFVAVRALRNTGLSQKVVGTAWPGRRAPAGWKCVFVNVAVLD